jgi:hypothetical protein
VCSSGCGSSMAVLSATVGPICSAPTAGTATVTGSAQTGATLTANKTGFGLGAPAGAYRYQWQRCSSSACTAPVNIGTNAATYVVAQADGGQYLRVGISVTNACGTATDYSPVTAQVKRVTLTKGATCSLSGCTSSNCHWYTVTLVGFSTASHAVTCNASNLTNPWFSYSTATFPSTGRCCYGFPGQTTWSTVDGLRSNNLTW